MSGYTQLSVLIVDDNRNMRHLAKTLLRAYGLRSVFDVNDATEAFELLRAVPIDVIVTDCLMQPIDGIEFTRMLRTSKDSPNTFIPIVMMTGHSEKGRVKAARDAGVNTFLVKPISAKSLLEHVIAAASDQRVFVRSGSFFGPDRRIGRQQDVGLRRRETDQANDFDLDDLSWPADGDGKKRKRA
jgi:two-component system, chemotaxis family, chemotaxis protein CheY